MMIATAFQDCQQTLSPIYGVGEARAMCRIIFEDAFDWRQGRRDREITIAEQAELKIITERLAEGEPLQYIMGQADFYGLQLRVSPAVLIPRPETEELVEWILDTLRLKEDAAQVLDIGTGSGCIPVAIKYKQRNAEMRAVDVSEPALAIARQNATKYDLEVGFELLDILTTKSMPNWPQFDIIISNPPYIPHSEADLMPENVKRHEPGLALFVENEDPLLFYRTIIAFAKRQLNKDGWLYFECNEYNAEDVAALAKAEGFSDGELRKDLQGKWRMWRGKA